MANSKQDIISFLSKYIRESMEECYKKDIYVGIAKDVKQRLFSDHNVDEKNGKWAYSKALSSDVSREVEKYFLDLGYKGGDGGGDDNTKTAYVYKIMPYTKE